MKILYYIVAYGKPNKKIKYELLNYNLTYIYNQIKTSLDVIINIYTSSPELTSLKKKNFINKLLVYEKKGVLTELFLTNPNNSLIKEYDYILFVLDDVKIVNIDIMKMIEIKKKYNFEILSPKIIKSSHSFMNKFSQGISVNNFLEIYFLLLTPKDFNTILSKHTIENKWMWGVDLLFGYYNIKVGVVYNFIAEHILESQANYIEAESLMIQYLKQYTPYNCIKEIENKYQPIKYKYNENEVLINILTRTGSRPEYFNILLDSLKNQTYKNYRHIISNDNPKCKYLENMNDVYFIDKSNILHIKDFYNLYLDTLSSKCDNGWIIIIDDDDKFTDNNFLENLAKLLIDLNENDVLIYQTKIDKHILPSNDDIKNNFIRYWGIGMCCFCVHHTVLKDITFKSLITENNGSYCGDYYIIKKIQESGKYNIKFIDTLRLPIGIWGNYDGQHLGELCKPKINLASMKRIEEENNRVMTTMMAKSNSREARSNTEEKDMAERRLQQEKSLEKRDKRLANMKSVYKEGYLKVKCVAISIRNYFINRILR